MSQFPNAKPKRKRPPVKDSYLDADYSPWMQFNGKDFASTCETTLMLQPVIVSIAAGIETMAYSMEPQNSAIGIGNLGGEFLTTWLGTTIAVAAMKGVACLLRDRGASLIRDIATWVWQWVFRSAWEAFVDMMFGWLPIRKRRTRIVNPDDDTDPFIPVPRRRWIDRLRPRKRQQ
jgi:hypothetical protein